MKPYESLELRELILRDRLAADRTSLANERTLLAYVRTALTLLVAGLAFLNVNALETPVTRVIGWCFIPVAVLMIIIGGIRYYAVRKGVKALRALTGHAGGKPDEGV